MKPEDEKRRVSYRLDEEDVGINLSWNNSEQLDRFDITFDGTELTSIPTFLEAARRSIENKLCRIKENKRGEEDENRIIDLPLWGIRDHRENGGPRVMATGEIENGKALFAKEWKYWNPEGGEASAIPRPPRIKNLHAENCMSNFRKAKDNPSLHPFINSWNDKCVIIVGSGPNLSENKKHIPADDPRFEVIAINEACRILDPEQIDFCFLADRAIGEHMEWFPDEMAETTPLISNCITPPEVVDKFDEVFFWRSNNLDNADDQRVLDRVQHLHPLDVGQTATYSAFHFAYLSGSPYIMFAGQDFSFNCSQYSAGRELTDDHAERMDVRPTDGIKDGEVVLTCDRLVRNMRLIKGEAAFVGDDGVVVTNATGGGIMDFTTMPNAHPQFFTPENNRNLDIKHAIQDAKEHVCSSGKRIENSYEVTECQVDTSTH